MSGGLTLITGATSGIGEALALALASERDLIVHGRDSGRVASLVSRCARPGSHLGLVADLRNPAEAGKAIGAVMAGGKRIECMVHSAGVTGLGPVRMADPEAVRNVFRVNVLSAVAMLREILVCGGGAERTLRNVVFISSAASCRGEAGAGVYSATKGALNGLVRALATELAPRTRVNAVLPGILPTPMSRATLASQTFKDRAAWAYPLGVGRMEDVVAAVSYLISDAAEWTTGTMLVVDGGRTVV